mmetsp:Transcript_85643/g.142635  ORF Transcript_85643/g.142635 Transcript_85643/m.142635 type:complete len:86 (+) Transcript_85643:849-1106(+)
MPHICTSTFCASRGTMTCMLPRTREYSTDAASPSAKPLIAANNCCNTDYFTTKRSELAQQSQHSLGNQYSDHLHGAHLHNCHLLL